MAAKKCKLTASIDNKECDYSVAGARALFLANFYPAIDVSADVVETYPANIVYSKDVDGYINKITLPGEEKFYRIGAGENTISATDTLLVNGSGGKYRQHTVNAVATQDDIEMMGQIDALSLGRFIAVAVMNSGKIKVLGRTNGLTAPAGGADFNSGAAEADAQGWTLIQQGTSMERAPLVKNEAVITPVQESVIIP